ncbi:TonB-dependent receptor [Chitinophaga sp. 212800010-3]|uniref:TonB-dependent receptor n=1 Tax=unclassified Chitinophaga TaxID=2619133 RepID=UPI002DE2E0AE|nr:TonB-linked outer membrane protein, SusC/RagA family [Chitinophaga sp. 212800010-3]
MKLTFLFLAVALLGVSITGTSQTITLNVQKAPVRQVFSAIEKQTNFVIFFNKEHLEHTQPVTVNVRNMPVANFLELVLKNQPITYEISQKNILIRRKSRAPGISDQTGEIHISGQVRNSGGEPLPGAGVMLRRTGQAISTDSLGRFTMEAVTGDVLLITFTSMAPFEITVGREGNMQIVLSPTRISQLDSVVVIGYGSVNRKNLTSAISTIKVADIPKSASTSVEQILAGRAAGLTAVQGSGQPGAGVSVQIRGNPSFASSGVLYVLDGVPVNGGADEIGSNTFFGQGVDRSPLNFLNPADIENIEVLKDASAASIYGARAGAGVVLITTKRGKVGRPSLNYSYSRAFQQPAKFYDVYNEKDFMTRRNEIFYEEYLRSNNLAPYGNKDPSAVQPFKPKYSQGKIDSTGAGVNIFDMIRQKAFVEQHNLSFSGGTQQTRYYFSGNYLNQQGIISKSSFKRYSGRFNFDQAITDRLKASVNITGSRSNSQNLSLGNNYYQTAGIILASIYRSPVIPLYDSAGGYALNPENSLISNPLSYLTIEDNTLNTRLLTSGNLSLRVIDGLTAKANFSYDQSYVKRGQYYPKTFLYGALHGGQGTIFDYSANIGLIEYTLDYWKAFGSHSISLLGGYSYQVSNSEGFNAMNSQFFTDAFLYNNLGAGSASNRPDVDVGSSKSQSTWASYFGRAIYTYKDKYILNGSIRRDGYSGFTINKKYGWFPSVSAAWKISNEPFMEALPFVSFMKLRAGYGTTGNSNIGKNAFSYYSTAVDWVNYSYVFGNSQSTGILLAQLANPNLTWESVGELNFGLDLGLLKDRISITAEYFNKRVSNLLQFQNLYESSLVPTIASNVGVSGSKGFELSLKTTNIANSNFRWNTEVNFSRYVDRWVERSPEFLKTKPAYVGVKDPFRAIYGYLTDGIMQAGEKAPSHTPNLQPGMIKVKDINGYDAQGNLTGKPDGVLNTADQVLLGDANPGFSFGFNNTFNYRNFDLSIFMYGMLHVIKYNEDKANAYGTLYGNMTVGANALALTKDAWAYNNQQSKNPSGLNNPYSQYTSNFFKERGDFLRCRSIALGYNLPSKILVRQHIIRNARVYGEIQNAFVITKYTGLDPELTGQLVYPNPRTFTIGASVNF